MTYHRVCNQINTTGVTSGAGPADPHGAPTFIARFSGDRVTGSLALHVCFVDHCLFFCPFFFQSLYCLFFFDIRIPITPLVSSNSSLEYSLLILVILDKMSTEAVASVASMVVTALMTLSASLLTTSTTSLLTKICR